MIEKVLIVEDHEIANISVQKTLEELGVIEPDHAYYCDDALFKIEKGVRDSRPYDLLITDLYFEDDYRRQKISGGDALITAARRIQPELRVLVFSAESKPAVIEKLFHNLEIDGYVRKARNDAKELKLAINAIVENQRYFPRHLMELVKQKNAYNFSEFDIQIITLLTKGIKQKDIPAYLERNRLKTCALSTVEKALKQMKRALNFTTNEQLVAYCKDMGIA